MLDKSGASCLYSAADVKILKMWKQLMTTKRYAGSEWRPNSDDIDDDRCRVKP